MFAKRLSELRKNRGLSQNELGEIFGVSQQTVARWESGVNYPNKNKLTELCNYFDVPLDYLFGNEKHPGVKIPVLGNVAAGIPIEAITDIEDYEEIPEAMARGGEYFALRIKGYSMAPRIMPGDIAIVRVQEDFVSGDLCIVRVNGNEVTMKEVKKTEEGLTLIGYNPAEYSPHFYSKKEVKTLPVQVIGVVKEVRIKSFKPMSY